MEGSLLQIYKRLKWNILMKNFVELQRHTPLSTKQFQREKKLFTECPTANPRNPKTAVVFTLSCNTYVYVCATVHNCTKTSYPTHITKTTRACNPKRARMHEQWRVLVMGSNEDVVDEGVPRVQEALWVITVLLFLAKHLTSLGVH